MMTEDTTQVAVTPSRTSVDEIRTELYRMIDELGTMRSLNAAKLQQRFDELWRQLGAAEEPTLH